VEYVTSVVFSVRTVLAAAASLAAMRDRIRFGMAMAAMIRMMATTISSSINEKPFCFRILVSPRKVIFANMSQNAQGNSLSHLHPAGHSPGN
jgi:hypothetical protein